MRDFSSIAWARQWSFPGADLEPAVVVDVLALDRLWSLDDGYYIGHGGDRQVKYAKFGQWFLANTGPIWMPHLSIDEGVVSFTDGRHRFAWLRDHGLRSLPVTVGREMEHELILQCGWRSKPPHDN